MKNKSILVALCIFIASTLFTNGQSLPTVAIGRAWSETAMINMSGMGNYAPHRYFMQDTLVWNTKTYLKVYETLQNVYVNYQEEPLYPTYYYNTWSMPIARNAMRQEGDKVWLISLDPFTETVTSTEEYLLYDFSVENIGDSRQFYIPGLLDPILATWTVTNITPYTLADGTLTRSIDFDIYNPTNDLTYTDTWIEGIGSTYSIINRLNIGNCFDMCGTFDVDDYCADGATWLGNNCTAIPTALCNNAPIIEHICSSTPTQSTSANNSYIPPNPIYGIQLPNITANQMVWLNALGDTITAEYDSANESYYLTNIPEGTYTLHLYDTCNNLAFEQTYTTNENLLNYPYTIVDTNPCIPCSTMINLSGLPMPYQLTWSNGMTENFVINLCSGNYEAALQKYGCYRNYSFMIEDSTPTLEIRSDNIITTPSECGLSGEIDASTAIVGGTPPYNYSWQNFPSPQPNQAHITNLQAGNYTLLVSDANLCTATTTIIVGQIPDLITFANATNALCNGGNGSVEITAISGTPPYIGTGTFNQSAGTQTYTVTDANGCTATVSATVLEPTIMAVYAYANDALCNGENGSITVTATGGTAPYIGAGTFVENVGTYAYTVTDANGCIATASATISAPTVLVAFANATNATCNGGNNGSVDLFITGGAIAYTYAWDNGSTTEDLSAIPAGIYNVTITDANNCSTYTFVEVEEDPPLDCNDNNPLTIDQLDTENCTCSHTYVGIEETFSETFYIYAYPNPADSDNDLSLRYQLPPNTSKAILQLYNLQGQLVLSQNIQQTQGNISINLPTGMFLAQLFADNLNIHTKIIVR
jgi:hypothetical protein